MTDGSEMREWLRDHGGSATCDVKQVTLTAPDGAQKSFDTVEMLAMYMHRPEVDEIDPNQLTIDDLPEHLMPTPVETGPPDEMPGMGGIREVT